MNQFDKKFWTDRYQNNEAGWDVGEITTPLKNYIDQLENKEIKILIPGSGNAYEAEYLFRKGFTDITIIDISEIPLKNIQNRLPDFPKENLILSDFFDHVNSYDLIIEQTFFCALHPSLRTNYVQKMVDLIKPNRKLVGVLFIDPLNNDHPPFAATMEEYKQLFGTKFNFQTFEKCYNSIKPRQEREIFVNFTRK